MTIRIKHKITPIDFFMVVFITVALIVAVLDPLQHEASAKSNLITNEVVQQQYKTVGVRTVTMYTSRPEETDASPCIGASGDDLCVLWSRGQAICASNEFPLRSVIRVEGLGECLVLDRMNKRYPTNVDFYNGYDPDCLDGYQQYDSCPQLKEAISFGSQLKEVKIPLK